MPQEETCSGFQERNVTAANAGSWAICRYFRERSAGHLLGDPPLDLQAVCRCCSTSGERRPTSTQEGRGCLTTPS
jgi:hypothetical protein